MTMESMPFLGEYEFWTITNNSAGFVGRRPDGADPGVKRRLLVESWCRVVGGSGRRHVITVDATQLVDEGFV